MKKKKRELMGKAKIYLIPTPIGNLRDITLRALDVLQMVDVIVCEDTRHTLKLLRHFGIKKPLISSERFSEAKRTEDVFGLLDEGKVVAIVTDAGTPGVSDPGSRLISAAHERGVLVEALPGPCALTTALSGSGFDGSFRFVGFFPRERTLAQKEVARMAVSEEITIFYESPRRIMKTLECMKEFLGDRKVCIARELSKTFEEYLIGTPLDLIDKLEQHLKIGEVTVLVEGLKKEITLDMSIIEKRAKVLLKDGYSKKDILDILVKETGEARNKIYKMLIEIG
jgi:16S rRNA (cytidine1402-2'-O)-methyltransferase